MKVQRLRIRYRLRPPACGLSNREQLAAWEAALKAGGIPLAYSEGKRPSAQLSVAALLPLGVTSDCELIDVFLSERVEPSDVLAALEGSLPDGIEPFGIEEIGVGSPSLQSLVQWAEFEAEVPRDALTPETVRARIEAFLAAREWPAEYRRETKVKQYDLRPLVCDLDLRSESDEGFLLRMRLLASQENTARADQVLLALELPPARRIHRRRLYVEETQPAIVAYRRSGEIEEGIS